MMACPWMEPSDTPACKPWRLPPCSRPPPATRDGARVVGHVRLALRFPHHYLSPNHPPTLPSHPCRRPRRLPPGRAPEPRAARAGARPGARTGRGQQLPVAEQGAHCHHGRLPGLVRALQHRRARLWRPVPVRRLHQVHRRAAGALPHGGCRASLAPLSFALAPARSLPVPGCGRACVGVHARTAGTRKTGCSAAGTGAGGPGAGLAGARARSWPAPRIRHIYTYIYTLTLPCPALPISQGPALTDDFWILMGRRGHMARLPGWSAALRTALCAPALAGEARRRARSSHGDVHAALRAPLPCSLPALIARSDLAHGPVCVHVLG